MLVMHSLRVDSWSQGPSGSSWQLHTSQVARRRKKRRGTKKTEMHPFPYCKMCLIDPRLIQHPLGLFIFWPKNKIRNHGFYLYKLSSYSGSFYSTSSPTHSLPSHDLFTLDFSAIWNFYRMHNISQQMLMQDKMGGSSF